MILTTKQFSGLVLVVSAVVIGAALLSQYWGGLDPCELCLLERWPWWAAIAISALVWIAGNKLPLTGVALALALIFLVSAGIGLYHVGVEQHWFPGPSGCTASGAAATSVDALRAQLLGKQPGMCDEVQWSLFGISLAGFNLIGSLVMAAFCAAAAAWFAPRRVTA
jgi:disulfide bond formation protein DsbB